MTALIEESKIRGVFAALSADIEALLLRIILYCIVDKPNEAFRNFKNLTSGKKLKWAKKDLEQYDNLRYQKRIKDFEWLKDFNKEERQIIDSYIKYPQYSWPWEMPRIKPLGDGLMEIRIKLKNRQARIFFILHDGIIILLHGFIKKTQKTPKNEIEIALKRSKQIKRK